MLSAFMLMRNTKEKQMVMQKKVWVCGFGFMGQTHAGNLLKIPGVTLAGIIDPCDIRERLSGIRGNQETVRIAWEDVADIPHYRSFQEAREKSEADILVIALPTKLHFQAVMDALKGGLDVFVEKPFSVSLTECELMNRTAAEHNRIIAVGQCVRFMREYAFLSETIRSGRLGELKFLKLNRITGFPDWGNWREPEFVKASGGALFDLLLHDVDYLRFCLGEPSSISAASRFTAEGVSMISAGFDYPGVHVSVEGGFVMPSSFPFQRSFSAFFERGSLNSSLPGKVEEFSENGRKEYDFSPDDPYYTEMAQFIDAVRSGDSSGICTGADAARTVACCRKIASAANYPLFEEC